MNQRQRRDPASVGTRVQISFRVLEPGNRADSVPSDTAEVPYEVKVRGVLMEQAALGEQAHIITQAGRALVGRVDVIEPADTHSFGRPPRALVEAQESIRALLEERSHE